MLYALFVMVRKKIYKESAFVKGVRIILIIVLLPFVLFYLIKQFFVSKRKKRETAEKIKIYNISQINSLSGEEFEEYLKLLFEQMGYTVSLTKKSKDFGVDLILTKNKKQTIVQAKCYSHTVGVSAVQEIISARAHYKIKQAMVVSNQNFSKEAEVLARENSVLLAGKSELEGLISKYPVYFETKRNSFVATTTAAINEFEKKYPYSI